MDSIPERGAPGAQLRLPLFADAELTAVLDRFRTDDSGARIWNGHVEGSEQSSVLLVANEGVMAGRVSVGERLYRIRYDGSGLHRIDELAPGRQPRVDRGALSRKPFGPVVAQGLPVPKPTSKMATFDLLALYTKAAKRKAGGAQGLRALIRLQVEVANMALESSRAKARVRLVGTEQVAYEESGSMGRDLAHLAFENDGEIERAFDLRDRYGADFVTLYVHRPRDPLCGQAYIGWSERILDADADPADSAFSVVRGNCPDWVLGHELGHNWGLLHARDDFGDPHSADETGATPFAYGYKYLGEETRFRTLMALNCRRCVKLLQLSNPRIRHAGVRTGVGRKKDLSADAVRALNRIRDELAEHRPCQVDCEDQ